MMKMKEIAKKAMKATNKVVFAFVVFLVLGMAHECLTDIKDIIVAKVTGEVAITEVKAAEPEEFKSIIEKEIEDGKVVANEIEGIVINDFTIADIDGNIYLLDEIDANWMNDDYNFTFNTGDAVRIVLVEDEIVAVYDR